MPQDLNQVIMKSLIEKRTEAAAKVVDCTKAAKKTRSTDKKRELLEEAEVWAKREATWSAEIEFRESMQF